jgi:hypothetical protein
VGEHVWARGATTWPEAIAASLAARGWTLATWEAGTAGSLATLLGGMDGLRRSEAVAAAGSDSLESEAERVRALASADVGLALTILARGSDTAVSVAVATPAGVHRERRVAFLGGVQGRHRAGLAAADILLRQLRQPEAPR